MHKFILVFQSISSKYSQVCLPNGNYHFFTSFPMSKVSRKPMINQWDEIIIALSQSKMIRKVHRSFASQSSDKHMNSNGIAFFLHRNHTRMTLDAFFAVIFK